MKQVSDFLEPFRILWEKRHNQLDNVLENLKNKEHGN